MVVIAHSSSLRARLFGLPALHDYRTSQISDGGRVLSERILQRLNRLRAHVAIALRRRISATDRADRGAIRTRHGCGDPAKQRAAGLEFVHGRAHDFVDGPVAHLTVLERVGEHRFFTARVRRLSGPVDDSQVYLFTGREWQAVSDLPEPMANGYPRDVVVHD